MITGYDTMLMRLQQLISGDDVNADAVEASVLSAVLQMAEQRIYSEVRSRHNEKAFTGTTAGNLFAMPSDYVACSVVHLGGKPLEPVAEEWAREFNDTHTAGDGLYFAEAGNSLLFAPQLADGTALQGRYFCRFPYLTAANFSSNTLAVNAGDVFLYAGLAEAAPMFNQDARIQLWEAKYEAVKRRLNNEKTRNAATAGRIRIRNSTQLIG
jgi:hypothetical protein